MSSDKPEPANTKPLPTETVRKLLYVMRQLPAPDPYAAARRHMPIMKGRTPPPTEEK